MSNNFSLSLSNTFGSLSNSVITSINGLSNAFAFSLGYNISNLSNSLNSSLGSNITGLSNSFTTNITGLSNAFAYSLDKQISSLSNAYATIPALSSLSNSFISTSNILVTVSNVVSSLSNSYVSTSNILNNVSSSITSLSNSYVSTSNILNTASTSITSLSNSYVSTSNILSTNYVTNSSFVSLSNSYISISNIVSSNSTNINNIYNSYTSTSNLLNTVSNTIYGNGGGSLVTLSSFTGLSNSYVSTSNIVFTLSNTIGSIPTTYATLTNFTNTSNIIVTVSNVAASHTTSLAALPTTYASLTNFNNTSNIIVTVSNVVASHTTSLAALPTTYAALTNFNNTSNILVTVSNIVAGTSSSLIALSNYTSDIPTANPVNSYPSGPMTTNSSTLQNLSYGNGTYVASSSTGTAWKAFDSNLATRWQTTSAAYINYEYTGAVTTTDIKGIVYPGEYVQIKLPTPIYLSSFDYSAYYAVPSEINLLGSTDGSNWYTISTFTSGIMIRNKTNFVVNPASGSYYNYFRFVIGRSGSQSTNAINNVECVELVLHGTASTAPSLNSTGTISSSNIAVDGNIMTSFIDNYIIDDVSPNNFNLYPYTTSGSIVTSKDSPYWSSYLDGSLSFGTSDYLQIPANQFNTPWWLNGGFTVEYWLKTSTTLSNSFVGALDISGSNNDNWSFGVNSNGFPTFRFALSNSTSNITFTSTSTTGIVANSWNHLAACFNTATSNVTMFLNGVPQSNIAQSNFFPLSNNIPAISSLSNFALYGTGNCLVSTPRLVYGVPIYTATFTAPTSPLFPNATGSNALVMRTPYVNKSFVATSAIQATEPQPYPPIMNFTSNLNVMSNAPYGNGTYIASESSYFGLTSMAYMAFSPELFAYCRWSSAIGKYTSNNGSYVGSVVTRDRIGNSYKGEWMQIRFPAAIYASSYSIALDHGSRAYSWSILGSTDGVNYDCVDIQDKFNTTTTTFNEWSATNGYISNSFALNPTSAYSYYRVVVHMNNPSFAYDYCSFGTFRVHGVPPTMSITRDGLIGLGVLNPSKQLDVGGDAGVSGTLTSSNAMIQNQMTVIGSITFSNNPSIGSPALGTAGTGDCFILQSAPNTTTYPYSVGLCNLTLWTSVPVGAQHSWYVGGSNLMGLTSAGMTSSNATITNLLTSSNAFIRNTLTSSNAAITTLMTSSNATVTNLLTSLNATITNQMSVLGSITFSNNPSVGPPAVGINGGSGDCFILQAGSSTTYPSSVGLCNLTLWSSVPVGAQHSWYVGGSNLLGLNSSGLLSSNVTNTNLLTSSNVTVTNLLNSYNIISQTDVSALSDKRVKCNLKRISNACSKIAALSGYTYNRTDLGDNSNVYAGLIAQEVQKVLPEVVNEQADGHLTISYGNMMALIVESMKDMMLQIQELQEKVLKD